MNRVDVAYSLLYDEQTNQILMVLNRKNGSWSLPGGAVEAGETLKEAAIREAKEETGYDVLVGDIAAVNEGVVDGNHVHFFTFHGVITRRPEEIPHEQNILKVEWKSLEEADRLMPYHPEGISKLLKMPGAKYTLQG